MVGVPRFELGTPCSQSKCATRLRYTPTRGLLGFFGYLSKRPRVRKWNFLDIFGQRVPFKSPFTYSDPEIPFIDPPDPVLPDQGDGDIYEGDEGDGDGDRLAGDRLDPQGHQDQLETIQDRTFPTPTSTTVSMTVALLDCCKE